MKIVKTLGLTLLYLGLIILLFGALATLLPGIENEQIRLILASFQVPVSNPALAFVHRQFLWMLANGFFLLLLGGGILVLSAGFLLISFSSAPKAPSHKTQTATRVPFTPQPVFNPKKGRSEPPGQWRRETSESTMSPSTHPFFPFPAENPSTTEARPNPSANPYRSYGYSAYAPPPKPTAPAPVPAEPSAYQRPSKRSSVAEIPAQISSESKPHNPFMAPIDLNPSIPKQTESKEPARTASISASPPSRSTAKVKIRSTIGKR